MSNSSRLCMAACVCFFALLILLIGVVRQDGALVAPVDFFMLLVVIAVYMLPTAIAVDRHCESIFWITLVNVFLGWSIFGWIGALGWANAGRVRELSAVHHSHDHSLVAHEKS